ncbi:MAG: archaellin/type IV pilin N-terminal domain-containing protein [Candidatus Bathyarchaeia archaeon]|jgi:flagellin-like protein
MKILRSRKALSPVVASIILIAVTVAVSIAVAAWMGALTFSFMGNGEQMQIGSPYGWSNGGNFVYVRVTCPSGNAITISAVRVNNVGATFTNCTWANGTAVTLGTGGYGPIPAQNTVVVGISYTSTWQSGYSYTIVITSAKNNEYQTTGTCP